MSNKQEVFETLQKHGRMTIDGIAKKIIDGEATCSECHHTTFEYNTTRENVRDGLRKLMDEGKVASTPDWKYYIPQRFQTECGDRP